MRGRGGRHPRSEGSERERVSRDGAASPAPRRGAPLRTRRGSGAAGAARGPG